MALQVGTLVLTASGLKAVETLASTDVIIGFNGGGSCDCQVTWMRQFATNAYTKLYLSTGAILITNPAQAFYSIANDLPSDMYGMYTVAGNIQSQHLFKVLPEPLDRSAYITGQHNLYSPTKPITVVDIVVSIFNNFFVTDNPAHDPVLAGGLSGRPVPP